jgi:hypothetical protein
MAQIRQDSARDAMSETVLRRWFQGILYNKRGGDVRPTALNLNPPFATASPSPARSLRNGMDLQTIHRDIVTDIMRVFYGILLRHSLHKVGSQPSHNVTCTLASSGVQYCPMTDVTCKIVLNV